MDIIDLLKVSPASMEQTLSDYLSNLRNSGICVDAPENVYFRHINNNRVIVGLCTGRNENSEYVVDGYFISPTRMMKTNHYRLFNGHDSYFIEYNDKGIYLGHKEMILDTLKCINNFYTDLQNKYEEPLLGEMPSELLQCITKPIKQEYFLIDINLLYEIYFDKPIKVLYDIIEEKYNSDCLRYEKLYKAKLEHVGKVFFNNRSLIKIDGINEHTCEYEGSVLTFSNDTVNYSENISLDSELYANSSFECLPSFYKKGYDVIEAVNTLYNKLTNNYGSN